MAKAGGLDQHLAALSASGLRPRDRQHLRKLLTLAAALPQVQVAPFGQRHLSLAVKRKTFAYYLNNHHDDGRIGLCCKATPAEQRALLAEGPERYYLPAYLARSGWVSLRLDAPGIDWNEVHGLLIRAWRLQAPRRLADEL